MSTAWSMTWVLYPTQTNGALYAFLNVYPLDQTREKLCATYWLLSEGEETEPHLPGTHYVSSAAYSMV